MSCWCISEFLVNRSIKGGSKLLLTKSYISWPSCELHVCMSLNLVILFRLNSGDECSLYVALFMQQMAFFCTIFSLLIYFFYRSSPRVGYHMTDTDAPDCYR